MNEPAVLLGWMYLPVVFVLGAFHALEPGHGKSLSTAFLVNGKHNWRDAAVLGLAATFSHTIVVVTLAFSSFALKGLFVHQDLQGMVTKAGAAVLIGLGGWTVIDFLRDGMHYYWHGHHHRAEKMIKEVHGLWGVMLAGLSVGLLPCPGALAALILALTLGQTILGLVTVLVYSLGVASMLVLIGILVVEAGNKVKKWLPSDKILEWLPFVSGLIIMSAGIVLLIRS